MKVCKFGGTSMANGETISRVIDIVKSDPQRKYIVVSAPGKRSLADVKVTDALYACFNEKLEKATARSLSRSCANASKISCAHWIWISI